MQNFFGLFVALEKTVYLHEILFNKMRRLEMRLGEFDKSSGIKETLAIPSFEGARGIGFFCCGFFYRRQFFLPNENGINNQKNN